MAGTLLTSQAEEFVHHVQQADIVIGIPSYNNVRTIGHVVQAAQAGLAKYFPQYNSVIVNSDGGSTDGTQEAVLKTQFEERHMLLLPTPQKPANRLSFPYHGIPGKGSAFRAIFGISQELGAKACAVMDSDLRSITPEWIDLLVRPVLLHGYDFVAPLYQRHKYDGTITNSIIYPLTRTLYGKRIRQPIGGDFGLSPGVVRAYLDRNDWESDVARFGIDIWMTTVAMAGGFRVCQSYLGAKLHDAKDPSSDLTAMLTQVLGSVFSLMEEFEDAWMPVEGSEPVDLFGFRYQVGLEPIPVNLEKMLRAFGQGAQDLAEVWKQAMSGDTWREIQSLGAVALAPDASTRFHLPDELWVRVVYEFATALKRHPVERSHFLRSFTPLYLGRVASFIIETREMNGDEFEDRMEALCMTFEQSKKYLRQVWRGMQPTPAEAEMLQDNRRR